MTGEHAFAESAAKIMAANKAARERFAAAASRMLKATMGEGDATAILREFSGQTEASGAESLEDRDVGKDDRAAGTAGSTAAIGAEPGGGGSESAEAIVGRGI